MAQNTLIGLSTFYDEIFTLSFKWREEYEAIDHIRGIACDWLTDLGSSELIYGTPPDALIDCIRFNIAQSYIYYQDHSFYFTQLGGGSISNKNKSLIQQWFSRQQEETPKDAHGYLQIEIAIGRAYLKYCNHVDINNESAIEKGLCQLCWNPI